MGSASAMNLTLNNTGGNPNNVYIFVTGASSDLTTYAGSSITLMNVKPANVFWVVQGCLLWPAPIPPVFRQSRVSLGLSMCSTSITFLGNATLEGHAFCNSGSISFASGNAHFLSLMNHF